MKLIKVLSTLFIICIAAVGCTADVTIQDLTHKQKQQVRSCRANNPNSQRIRKEGSVIGCLSSLALSNVAGFRDSATLMCAAGGLAGYLIGNNLTERKCEYATLERQLDSEIEHITRMNNRFGLLLKEQALNIQQMEEQSARLLAEKKHGTIDTKELDNIAQKIIVRLGKEQYIIEKLEQEYQYKLDTITSVEKLANARTHTNIKAHSSNAITHTNYYRSAHTNLNTQRVHRKFSRDLLTLKTNFTQFQENNDSLLKINQLFRKLCNCENTEKKKG